MLSEACRRKSTSVCMQREFPFTYLQTTCLYITNLQNYTVAQKVTDHTFKNAINLHAVN